MRHTSTIFIRIKQKNMLSDSEVRYGQMTCPKCGCTGPTIAGPCPVCGFDGKITQRIYKYPLTGAVRQKLKLPYNANVLRAAVVQGGTICLYAMVDANPTKYVEVEVGVLGTGWDVPPEPVYDPKNHFMTVDDNGFVWHIFIRA